MLSKTDSGHCWAGDVCLKWTTTAATPTASPAENGQDPLLVFVPNLSVPISIARKDEFEEEHDEEG